ncbi:hypothetical protein ACT691_11110 [Vibrio metschnikovii]
MDIGAVTVNRLCGSSMQALLTTQHEQLWLVMRRSVWLVVLSIWVMY